MNFNEFRMAHLLEELAATDELLTKNLAELDRHMHQQKADEMRAELADRERFEDAVGQY